MQVSSTSSETTAQQWQACCVSIAAKLSTAATADGADGAAFAAGGGAPAVTAAEISSSGDQEPSGMHDGPVEMHDQTRAWDNDPGSLSGKLNALAEQVSVMPVPCVVSQKHVSMICH